jgi:hypothetical protein
VWSRSREVLIGSGAGLVVAILARLFGASLLTSALEGIAFSAAWLIVALMLHRDARRR